MTAQWLEGLQALAAGQREDEPAVVRLATVAADHVRGNPRLVFDGESTATTKAYPRLQDVRAGERVMCVRAGSTYVVLGPLPLPVTGSAEPALGPLVLRSPDTRSVNDAPGALPVYGISAQFKNGPDVGLPAGFAMVVTHRPWSDDSGGQVWQVAYHADRLYTRRGSVPNVGDAGTWGAWRALRDADTLSGLTEGQFSRKGHQSAANDVNPNIIILDSATGGANRYLATGAYNLVGTNTNSPWGNADGRWWFLQVYAHVYGAHWQRQIAWDMTAGDDRTFTRRCTGGDPNVASSWTGWVTT